MWLVAGLGNPGRQYAGNRHNAGFMVVDQILRRVDAQPPRARMGAEISEASVAGDKVVFCKPMEFMNVSGTAISRAAGFWKIPSRQILVIHDDMDLDFGRMKLVEGGGTGGHNGLRSIVSSLGTEAFCRLRFGIGRPPAHWEGADFVLADFTNQERQILVDLVEEAADAAQAIVKDGLVVAMNKFNRRKKEPTGGAA
jgi:peptidyl-tRNA hydrolase, PTH1 family